MSDGSQSVYPSGGATDLRSASSQMADTLENVTPPPESAAAPVRSLAGALPEPPLRRWQARAELPALRAQLRRAERKRDVERERLIAAALARALIKRRCELDIAVRLARRAVLLGDDGLRMELSSWHCQLGQTDMAVGMLTPLLESPGLDRARLSLRIALYCARLGQAEGAVAALREASAHDPDDPLIYELLATVHGWAPGATSAIQAADAYLKAAARRAIRRDEGAAFQDTLRAFDTAPEHAEAALALSRALVSRGQPGLVDEVWRRHAEALRAQGNGPAASAVHRRRLQVYLEAGLFEQALTAAFEAELDAAVDATLVLACAEGPRPDAHPTMPTEAGVFDWLSWKLGLSELLAARLELAAEAAEGPLRSRCYLALGNFVERELGNTERALQPWLLGLVADPGSESARAALERHAATTGDYSPLIEALLRVGAEHQPASPEAALSCLGELRRLARERLGDPGLELWCVEQMVRHGAGSDELLQVERALVGPASQADAALDDALSQLETLDGDARVSALRQAAAVLCGRPARVEQYQAVLTELGARRPDELRWRRLLEAVLGRVGDTDGLARLWTADLVTASDPNLALRSLMGLARLERHAGNLQGALAVLAADDGHGLAPAAGMQLSLAAQLGNRRLRAEGLLKLAVGLAPGLRADLASVASAELVLLGERTAALRAAEVGTHADPSARRPMVAYANAAAGRRDRVAVVAYERAMALTFPSSVHCRGLVAALDALGDAHASQVWTGRWLGLRPADTAAATQLLRASAEAGDSTRLGDVVSWTVSQAHPLAGWAEPLAHALTCLADSDRARAVEMAWRVLDAFGPGPPVLKQAVLVVSRRSGVAELEVAVLERELAGDAADIASLWRLAELHAEQGEVDRACAVLVRSVGAGLDPKRVLGLLESLPEAHSPEGEFHRLQARAQAHELCADETEACWHALRDYGAALWDLARDQTQAVEVWLRAAELGGTYGWFHFARDLVEVLGLDRALDEVCRLAETRAAPGQVAALLTGAALVSKNRGSRRRALQLGLLALDTDPANVWALEIIESVATPADMPGVESAYRAALGATLGSYGERALHYRAARFFERASDTGLALSHAIAAFRAVPSEGVTFALMLRLAQGVKEAERAAAALEEVAANCQDGQAKSQWLRRAALVAGRTSEGAQQRMEVLLRALLACPDTETVDLLGRAFTDLARQQPDGRSLALLRFSRAVSKLVPRLESIDGARVALAMASVALSCFSDARLTLQALAGAVSLDPEVDEFAEFVAEAARLGADADAARAFLDHVSTSTRWGERASGPLLELCTELAASMGTQGRVAGFMVRRLEREPESAALRSKAEQAVRRSREIALPAHVRAAFPEVSRFAESMARAERAAAELDAEAELGALAEAFEMDARLPGEVIARLLELCAKTQNSSLAERVLVAARESDLDPDAILAATRTLAASLIEQRRPQRALKLLLEATDQAPSDLGLLTQALAAARAAGEDDRRQDLLSRLIELTPDAIQKSSWLNEAWEVAKKRGQPAEATEILRRWLASDPEDTQALSRLEAECEARQDWAELAELIARHLALGVSFRERRRLVLLRSELLESKLGRPAEARQELLALVEQAPADRTVVERLAQVSEDLGDHVAAAGAWLTASGLSSTRPAAAQLAERACQLFLDSGEVMSARRVLAAPQTLPRSLGLARLGVRLERDGENEPRLARALEELAGVEEQPSRDRAAALLEAANLWRRLGDDERACQSASQAARWLPEDVEAQILASYLEYRRRGAPSQEEARATVERMQNVWEQLSQDQLDLAAFLLAEALDRVEGGEAGLMRLRSLQPRLGSTPLLSVVLAERLARGPTPKDALPHFDVALNGGDLRGLRKPSQLALEAARAAQRAELFGLVHRYAKLADNDPELAEEIARLREELPSPASPSMPPSATGSSPGATPPPPPPHGFAPTGATSRDGELQTRPARRTQIGIGRVRPEQPSAAPRGRASLAPTGAPPALSPPDAARAAMEPVRPSEGREARVFDDPKVPAEFVPRSSEERALFEQLKAGSAAAGRQLCETLSGSSERADAALSVGLLLNRCEPGDAAALSVLERAAALAGDAVHMAALAHVRRISEGVDLEDLEDEVPALEDQIERVELLRGLLFSEPDGLWPKALEVIWESTRRVLEWESVRDIQLARHIRQTPRSSLGDTYVALSGLLGLSGTPLLQMSASGEHRVRVIMLAEPSVLVHGDPSEDSPQLRYDLGAALAGTLPPYTIINAATYEQIGDLFRAVHAAFGPPETSQTNFTSTARLAALLWESVPQRTQRLMIEWCKDGKLTRDWAVASARRAARRAGLFAAGNLGVALGRVVADEGIDPTLLEGGAGLARLCARSLAAADLVRLACDPVYAHLRWRPAPTRLGAGLTRRGL
jgi:tetratricopeptide (TPR) repeat protein